MFNRSDVDGYNTSFLSDYNPNAVKIRDSVFNQNNLRKNKTDYYGLSFSYTEPIGRDKIWELNYAYNNNSTESDRQTYDLDPVTKKYQLWNAELSNHFDNLNEYHRIGTNFRVLKKRYNYQVGASLQHTNLNSNDLTAKSVFEEDYTNLLTNASFNYQFARSKSLRFNYRGRTNQPTISQLQPVRDQSNPNYITEGNPDLGQEFSNNFNLSYQVFDPIGLRNLFVNLGFSNTYNKIVNSTQHGKRRNFPQADGRYQQDRSMVCGRYSCACGP